jgi:plasmid maintenance system killer protein
LIKSFADKVTEEIFHGINTHVTHTQFSSGMKKLAQRKLDLLNCADSLETLRMIPANTFDLVRDVEGKYSIPIFENWRVLFRWDDSPSDVEIKK